MIRKGTDVAKFVTKRQNDVLKALKAVINKGKLPTFRAIAEETGCCLSYAYIAILSLEKKGFVDRRPGKHGGLSIATNYRAA